MNAPGERTDSISVFLVEDHDLVRRTVAQLIEAEPDMTVVGEAATVAGALGALSATRPNIALIDIRLHDGNGIELCREIRARFPRIQCLMLTSFSDDRAVLDSALAGAAGFVLKQIRSNHIVDSIRAIAAGQVLLDSETVHACLRRLRESEARSIAQLTEAQRTLFELIGEGRSNLQIAQMLGTDIDVVQNDVSVLLRRLGMVRRTEVSDAYSRTTPSGVSRDLVQ